MTKNAIILLSGGMDSTTCLAIAKQAGYRCYALSFDYGHRSISEVRAAQKIAEHYDVAEYKIAKIDIAAKTSALVDPNLSIPENKPAKREIPITYVPARNTIFLAIALGYAEEIASRHIFYGANVVDYSNYPDCRPEYIQAFENLAKLATKIGVEGYAIKIEAPLMYLRKSEIIRRGIELGVDYSVTVSCYQADEEGRACGKCSSCTQRRDGFLQAQVADPTRYY